MPDAVSDAQTVTSENRAEFMANLRPKPTAAPAPVAESPAPVAPAPAPVPAEAPAPAEEGTPAPAAEPAKKNNGIETRFSELTKQRDAERTRAEAAERRASEAEAKLNPPKPADDATIKPKPADFTDAFEYAEKLAEWSASEALRKRDVELKKEASDRSAREVRDTWVKRATAVEAEHPDYREVLAASDLKVSDQVRDALMESDHGPRILYALAQDPELVERIGKMTVTGALRAIGRLEAKFESAAPAPAASGAPTPPPRPKLPEPITPIRAVTGEPADSDAKYKARPDAVFVGGGSAH